MTFNLTMDIGGLEEAEALLAGIPRQLAISAHAKAMNAAANQVADVLERNTPIKAEDTGGLLDKGVLRENVMIVTDVDSQGRGAYAEIGFGKYGFAAAWVEWGHAQVGHKPGKKPLGEVIAHPFMRPSTLQAAEAAVDAYADSLRGSIAALYPNSETKVA